VAGSEAPFLEYLTWKEAADLLRLEPVGLWPIGAIEAHGPHLPLNTDVVIATAMARRASSMIYASGIPAVVLPSISYSVSFAGACFSGTSPVTRESFAAYLTSVIEELMGQGFRAISICNAHLEPAHVSTIESVVSSVNRTSQIPILFTDQRQEPWAGRLGEEFERGARHAGQYETSIVLAEAPGLVRREHLEEMEPVWIDLPAALRAGATNFAEAGATQGYFGNPKLASAGHGDELLDTLGEMIRDGVIAALAQRN
jgi:creatinine amidohydrolase